MCRESGRWLYIDERDIAPPIRQAHQPWPVDREHSIIRSMAIEHPPSKATPYATDPRLTSVLCKRGFGRYSHPKKDSAYMDRHRPLRCSRSGAQSIDAQLSRARTDSGIVDACLPRDGSQDHTRDTSSRRLIPRSQLFARKDPTLLILDCHLRIRATSTRQATEDPRSTVGHSQDAR